MIGVFGSLSTTVDSRRCRTRPHQYQQIIPEILRDMRRWWGWGFDCSRWAPPEHARGGWQRQRHVAIRHAYAHGIKAAVAIRHRTRLPAPSSAARQNLSAAAPLSSNSLWFCHWNAVDMHKMELCRRPLAQMLPPFRQTRWPQGHKPFPSALPPACRF